jgi:hypothetical protein
MTIVFIFVLLFGSFSWADQLSTLNQTVYNNGIKICKIEQQNTALAKLFQKSLISSYEELNLVIIETLAGNTFTAQKILHQHGLISEIKTMLDSDGFYQALLDCFPDSEESRHTFVLKLILVNALARSIATVGGTVLNLKAIALLNKSIIGMYRLTVWGRTMTLAQESILSQKIAKLISIGIVAPFLITLLQVIYDQYREDQKNADELFNWILKSEVGIDLVEQEKLKATSAKELCALVQTQKQFAFYLIDFSEKLKSLDSKKYEKIEIQHAIKNAMGTYKLMCK